MVTGHRFRRSDRLRRAGDYASIYALRQSVGDRVLLVFGRENGMDHSRLGLSVSRKVGGAVQRNRWKRLIREAFRRQRASIPTGWDFIVIPRRDAQPTLIEVEASLVKSTRRLHRRLRRDPAC